jgi:hypothetical protein
MTCGPKDTHIKKTVKIGFIHEVLASRAVQTPDSTVHSRPKKHNSCIKNAGFHLSSPPNQTIKCYRSTVVNAHTVHEHYSSNEWMCTVRGRFHTRWRLVCGRIVKQRSDGRPPQLYAFAFVRCTPMLMQWLHALAYHTSRVQI